MSRIEICDAFVALIWIVSACGGDASVGENGTASIDASSSYDTATVDTSNAGGAAGGGGESLGGTSGGLDGGSQDPDVTILDVRSRNDAGSGPITIASGLGKPTGIALGSTSVFWADELNGTILSCPKTGCVGAPSVVVANISNPQGIAVHGATLFWVNRILGGVGGTMRCTLGACGAGQIIDLRVSAGGPLGNVGIAIDDRRFYVVGGGLAVSCPIDGCGDAGTTTFGVVNSPIFGVALGPGTLYLARVFGTLKTCPLSGCSSAEDETLLVTTHYPFAIAVDDGAIYWSEYSVFPTNPVNYDAAIRSCPVAGCDLASAKVLAAGLIGPYAIAVDDANLFYTDHRNGRVERIPKNDSSLQCGTDHLGACTICGTTGATRCDGTCVGLCSDAGAD